MSDWIHFMTDSQIHYVGQVSEMIYTAKTATSSLRALILHSTEVTLANETECMIVVDTSSLAQSLVVSLEHVGVTQIIKMSAHTDKTTFRYVLF